MLLSFEWQWMFFETMHHYHRNTIASENESGLHHMHHYLAPHAPHLCCKDMTTLSARWRWRGMISCPARTSSTTPCRRVCRLTMQPFDPRLLMILPVEVSHGDRDWLYQPGLSHADSKPLITRRLKAKRILKRIHFHHKRRRRRRLTVEPSSSLRIGTRTDLLTSYESTTPIPSKAVGGNTASESPGLQSNKGSDDNTQRMKPRGRWRSWYGRWHRCRRPEQAWHAATVS